MGAIFHRPLGDRTFGAARFTFIGVAGTNMVPVAGKTGDEVRGSSGEVAGTNTRSSLTFGLEGDGGSGGRKVTAAWPYGKVLSADGSIKPNSCCSHKGTDVVHEKHQIVSYSITEIIWDDMEWHIRT